MEPKKMSKLMLKKETVSNLTNPQMRNVVGGGITGANDCTVLNSCNFACSGDKITCVGETCFETCVYTCVLHTCDGICGYTSPPMCPPGYTLTGCK